MKLRSAMLLGIACLVVGIIGSTVLAAVYFVNRAEERELRDDLERSRSVFEEVLGYRRSRFRSDCRVVANEPRLRAVVATQEIDHDTILGVVSELRASLGSDLFLLTDGEGYLLADVLDPEAQGFDLSKKPLVAAALAEGEGSGVWIDQRQPYQVQACQVRFGNQPAGVVIIGDRIDGSLAQNVYRQTGSAAAVALNGQAVVASSFPGEEQVELSALEAAIAGVPGDAPAKVSVRGATYLALGRVVPGYEGDHSLRFLLLRSLDEALAPGRRLTRSVLVIAGAALLAALLFAVVLSRRLSRPLDELVRFTSMIGRGETATRARVAGASEVKTLAAAMNSMVEELEASRQNLALKERLEREMEIAMRIQTSILPRDFEVHGLEIAARMNPAAEVGGDYYDVFPVEDGCWIGIGDVAGHGLTAGLEMLMVQSVVAALVRENPTAAPQDHVRVLNHVMYDNVRNRLKQDEHITLTLLRYTRGGRLTFAGAHEDIILCRSGADSCERTQTSGTWLGAMLDVGPVTRDHSLELGEGDLMVLYSDGMTESKNEAGEQYGIERLCRRIHELRDRPVAEICDQLFRSVTEWTAKQDDDMSVVVVRQRAERRQDERQGGSDQTADQQ